MDFLVWGQNAAAAVRAYPVDRHNFEGVRELLSQAGCKESSDLICVCIDSRSIIARAHLGRGWISP